jgi:hypothetical protein
LDLIQSGRSFRAVDVLRRSIKVCVLIIFPLLLNFSGGKTCKRHITEEE